MSTAAVLYDHSYDHHDVEAETELPSTSKFLDSASTRSAASLFLVGPGGILFAAANCALWMAYASGFTFTSLAALGTIWAAWPAALVAAIVWELTEE